MNRRDWDALIGCTYLLLTACVGMGAMALVVRAVMLVLRAVGAL